MNPIERDPNSVGQIAFGLPQFQNFYLCRIESGKSAGKLEQVIVTDQGSSSTFESQHSFVIMPQGYLNPDTINPLASEDILIETTESDVTGASTFVRWHTYRPVGWRRLGKITIPLDFPAEAAKAFVSIAHDKQHRRLSVLWHDADEEEFEDGLQSRFGGEIAVLIKAHREGAVRALERFIIGWGRNYYISAEALKAIGGVEDSDSQAARCAMLARFLEHDSELLREGAALGLENLDDRMAVVALKKRLAKEPVERLRQDFNAIIRYLLR